MLRIADRGDDGIGGDRQKSRELADLEEHQNGDQEDEERHGLEGVDDGTDHFGHRIIEGRPDAQKAAQNETHHDRRGTEVDRVDRWRPDAGEEQVGKPKQGHGAGAQAADAVGQGGNDRDEGGPG